MMRLKSDLLKLMVATAEHKLDEVEMEFDTRPAVCVVMSSGGYPGDYKKGLEITGIDEANAVEGVKVFHAGTAMKNGKLVTNGGRVLGVTAIGDSIADAQERAYGAVTKVQWDGAYWRNDIADKALKNA
jgi:phosphoribosylamine--glycine ligase